MTGPRTPGPTVPSHQAPDTRTSRHRTPGTLHRQATGPPDWLRGLTFATLETGTCTHAEGITRLPAWPRLRHLIEIRNPTCTAPGCRRAAARCDLDHVTPYDQGGRTCECNLHPASKS